MIIMECAEVNLCSYKSVMIV